IDRRRGRGFRLGRRSVGEVWLRVGGGRLSVCFLLGRLLLGASFFLGGCLLLGSVDGLGGCRFLGRVDGRGGHLGERVGSAKRAAVARVGGRLNRSLGDCGGCFLDYALVHGCGRLRSRLFGRSGLGLRAGQRLGGLG